MKADCIILQVATCGSDRQACRFLHIQEMPLAVLRGRHQVMARWVQRDARDGRSMLAVLETLCISSGRVGTPELYNGNKVRSDRIR